MNAVCEHCREFEPPAEMAVWIESLIDGDITSEQHNSLTHFLKEDAAARRRFLDEMQMHAALKWDGLDGFDADEETGSVPTYAAPPFTLFTAAVHNTLGFFSQEIPFAMLIASVITCLGLLAGSMIYVAQPQPVANDFHPSKSTFAGTVSERNIVGRVTGMVDCRWEGSGFRGQGSGKDEPMSLVALGDKFALASGLLEITYDTGAKVILQGPVAYDVESAAGGYLSVGRLTARLEKRGEVESRQVRDVNSKELHSALTLALSQRERGPDAKLQSTIPNLALAPRLASQFTVRTPTATVTDLGTEFGVNVTKDHTADVCVFEGTVEVEQTTGVNAGQAAKQRLGAGESVRLDATVGITPVAATSIQASFVRKLPSQRISTGLERGLVAYWSFDDAANLGKNATGGGDLLPENSPEHEPAGVIGGALRLHGIARKDMLVYHAGHGVPAGVPVGDTSYSISAWLRTSSQGTGNLGILGWGEPSFNRANVLVVKPYGARFLIGNYWWDYDLYQDVDKQQILGNWHHLAATYDRRTKLHRMFLDGKWLASRGVSEQRELGGNNFAIGRGYLDPNGPGEFFDGCLDEIGIWDRELSEAEIDRLYSGGKGRNPLVR